MAALGKRGDSGSLGFAALLGLHRLAEAVALAIHLENLAVVSETVQERRGHPLALEDLIPLAERQVARHQEAAALVAVGEHPEEQLDAASTHRDVSQFVADPQGRPVQLTEA